MKRILIVDDHALIRLGMRHALSHELAQPEIGEAQDARSGLELVRNERWDLVILDINLPDRSGLDIILDIRRAAPKLPVLIVSGCCEDEFAIHALKAGAGGFINKMSPPAEIMRAVRKVLGGERYMSPGLAENIALGVLRNSDRPLHEDLSEREFQVMRLLASGKTVSEVALELALSVKTVSTYRARILEKTNLRTNAEMTRYAMTHRLLE